MYKSRSNLLKQETVQDAANENAAISKAANVFDEIHLEADALTNPPRGVKKRKVDAKKKLMALLDAAEVDYSG